jgi:hypothetical protein
VSAHRTASRRGGGTMPLYSATGVRTRWAHSHIALAREGSIPLYKLLRYLLRHHQKSLTGVTLPWVYMARQMDCPLGLHKYMLSSQNSSLLNRPIKISHPPHTSNPSPLPHRPCLRSIRREQPTHVQPRCAYQSRHYPTLPLSAWHSRTWEAEGLAILLRRGEDVMGLIGYVPQPQVE